MHSVIFIIGRGQFLLLLYCLRRAAHARGARCCFVFLLIVSQRYRMESKQRFVSPFVLFLRMIPYIMKSQDSWHKAGHARSPISMINIHVKSKKCWSSLFAIYDFDHRLCASLVTILAIETAKACDRPSGFGTNCQAALLRHCCYCINILQNIDDNIMTPRWLFLAACSRGITTVGEIQ